MELVFPFCQRKNLSRWTPFQGLNQGNALYQRQNAVMPTIGFHHRFKGFLDPVQRGSMKEVL
jgi:hypothetical protein